MSIQTFLNTLKIDGFKKRNKITDFDIALFLRQLATLISAGMVITHSFTILEKTQKKIEFSSLINSIKKKLIAGKPLFYCFLHYPQHFDHFICQLIRIGEHTGKLDLMLLHIADYKERNLKQKKQIKQALFYPCFILLIMLLVTFYMFAFLIPRFAVLFQDKKENLPWITNFLFDIALYMQTYLSFFIFFICIIFFLQYKFNIAQYYIKKILPRLPLIKNFMNKIICARFARSLAITSAAGLPITEALQLSTETSQNDDFLQKMTVVSKKISCGIPLHQAMQIYPYFPPLMIQMIKLGEDSGKFETMLSKLADIIDADIEQDVHYFNQLLEPLVIVLLGFVIGGLLIALYLPIFKLGSAF